MNRLEEMLDSHPLPSWRPVAWPVMILLASAIIWANFSELDEVALASGEVVPKGKVKLIQHLEGGIIQKIHVADGDTVKKGQPLVRLNLATSGVNREELQVRLDSQVLVQARLKTETQGGELKFPQDAAARRPLQVIAQRQSYNARKRELNSVINVQKNQVRQRELEVQELESKRRSVDRNLTLAKERLKMSAELLADGLTPKIEHLKLLAEVEDLDGESRTLGPSIRRARAAVAEARGRMREEKTRFRREAQDELVKTGQAIGRITELLVEATEQGGRAEIKSPIDGVVKNMRYNTIGGVVSPGEPIMEIVPTGDTLVIDAKVNPVDRAYITKGQRTVVKISAYDYSRYGGLDGVVAMVAPDSSTDERGNPYFRILVETDKTYLGEKEGDLPITPGMQATIDIHTGKKTVMDYLLKPVLKLRHEAFRER
ncbi:MAG: HlyD family type I secretion periplasmic adaptor subunit [Proteobacteria bacterium]|nr:HlyD family type I secretion periplasmic adaptor subunit [Pseudomonadota bacterium]